MKNSNYEYSYRLSGFMNQYIVCSIYIDRIYMVSGSGPSKKEAKKEAHLQLEKLSKSLNQINKKRYEKFKIYQGRFC